MTRYTVAQVYETRKQAFDSFKEMLKSMLSISQAYNLVSKVWHQDMIIEYSDKCVKYYSKENFMEAKGERYHYVSLFCQLSDDLLIEKLIRERL